MWGSGSDSVTVTVMPIVNFTVNGSSTGTTVDPSVTFTLAWSTQGATSCTASGSWSGSKATNGSENHSQDRVGTYNYTLTCVGPNGTAVRTLTVDVTQNCPGGCGGGGDTKLLPEPPAEGIAELPPLAKMNHLARPRLQSGGATIIRTTYSIAGQVIATRVSSTPANSSDGLYYHYSDHLGSNSVMVYGFNMPGTSEDELNTVLESSRTWYLPFGGYRPGSAPTQTITDRDFTGQRENMELGLLYYQARYYVPGLGRFASADTIVPNPADPQSYNRYSYVRNSPLNFTDPTGHMEVYDDRGGGGGGIMGDEAMIIFLVGLAGVGVRNPDALDNMMDSLTEVMDDVLSQAEEVINSTPDLELQPERRRDYRTIPDLPSNDDRSLVIYQFNEPHSIYFKNGPTESDFDGISVAVADICGTPSQCLSAMFDGRPPTANDYYRQTTVGNLQDEGFTVTLNGGQSIPGTVDMGYPLVHASVTHPSQNYRDNGSPTWTKGLKKSFNGVFTPGQPVMN